MKKGYYIKPDYIKEISRDMRKNPTPAEEALWERLKMNALGVRFNRQKPIFAYEEGEHDRFYIADFYCHAKRLIIEIDGSVHQTRKEYDIARDAILKARYTILRFSNEEILNDINKVISLIEKSLER